MISPARWARPHPRPSARARGIAPFLLAVLTALTAAAAGAQQPTGRIVGRVVDASSGAGLSDVGVQVVGTTLGTMSGVDGRFTLANVPAGTVTIQARRIGYAPKTVTGLMLQPGATLEQDVSLGSAAVKLTAQVVTAAAERGSVSAALDQQRRATQIVNSVTAEQIRRSPDADAAQAVQRVSGVTVQGGRYVFVRGLGERYTTASLNGTRLPSPEPERKVVPLDLFPSGLLQSVTTSKTFTPDQQGDFSGASVDIRTREFPARRQVTFSSSVGFNDNIAGKDAFFAPGVGGEAFALAGSARDLPRNVAAAGNFQSGVSRSQQNALINSFRNVWRAGTRSGTPNGSLALSVGGNDPVAGHRVGYLLSGTYSYGQESNGDQVRALARPGSAPDAPPVVKDRFVGRTDRNTTLWGGLLNLSTLVGTRTRLSLNNTYNRTADNEARVETGSLERSSATVDVQRLDYVQRSVYSSQLAGEHDLGRQKLDWAGTFSGVTRDQPDRSELVYQHEPDPITGQDRLLWFSTGEGAVRTFADLREHSVEGRLNYQIRLGAADRANTVKLGALGRTTSRDADTRAYEIDAFRMSLDDRALPPEEIFGGRFTGPNDDVLQLNPLGQGGAYTARDQIAAGYAMADVGLSDRLRLVGGARLEHSSVEVNAVPTLGSPSTAKPTYTDVLPSLALNYRLTELQNLRFSATRTLARPEYRELSDLTTRDVIGGVLLRGNPSLRRTLIDNADVRYEWYPNPGEVLSFGVFAKRFHDPIERVYQPTSSDDIVTFANADAGSDVGVEAEARKGLGFIGGVLEPLSVFANATLMKSEVDLGAAKASSTNTNRRMVGQAPYVVNTGLTYTSRGGATSATLLYNRVGERIVNAGANPLPDVVEHPRDVLDLSLRFPLFVSGLAGRVDAKNLLDARYLVTQGPVTRESYDSGRGFSFGVSWQP